MGVDYECLYIPFKSRPYSMGSHTDIQSVCNKGAVESSPWVLRIQSYFFRDPSVQNLTKCVIIAELTPHDKDYGWVTDKTRATNHKILMPKS